MHPFTKSTLLSFGLLLILTACGGEFNYIAGDTEGDLDGNTLTGNRDFFVTRFDSTGIKQ